ncbi:M10 family metallopeptidase C-terminal domain-containing protein [Salipiger sp.]|uniref:M10 family metallopeptidase C-terminal domain-containing protein n=1 Tax=Salipiger sp. TaxID=2078585 RepID=UPI003A96CC21
MYQEPTAEEQLLLELVNRARANPSGEFDELIVNAARATGANPEITSALNFFNTDMDLLYSQLQGLAAVAPVAWHVQLAESADTHGQLMIDHDTQSHNVSGEPDLLTRISNAGYQPIRQVAENVFSYAYNVLYAHAGFYIDWGGSAATGGIQDPAGHRITILNPTYTEVGISIIHENNSRTAVGPLVVTQHFGTTWGAQAQLLGVVIDDLDDDDFYDVGEGMGGVTVTAVSNAGTYTTTTWASGGYQMVLPAGRYTVTFSGGGLDGNVVETVTMGSSNVKVDAEADAATTGPGNGPDDITGTGRSDDISGYGGDDMIRGLGGNDTLRGGAGNDTLDGGGGGDHIDGGPGRDTVSYESATRSVRVDLQNAAYMYNDAVGDTFTSVEVFRTGNASDQLRGDSGSNVFYTGGSSDRLYGRAGDDFLYGEGGADAFYGGMGADTMTGGDGARRDRFIFFNMAETGVGAGQRDVITDFTPGEDRIEISRFDADLTQGFKQSFTFVGDTFFSGNAGELRYGHSSTSTIIMGDVDGDRVADFEIELIGIMDLSASDFLL